VRERESAVVASKTRNVCLAGGEASTGPDWPIVRRQVSEGSRTRQAEPRSKEAEETEPLLRKRKHEV